MAIPLLSGVGDLLNTYQHQVSDPISGSILLGLNQAKMGLGLGDQGSQQLAQYGNGMPSFGGAPTSDPTGALSMAFNTPGSENPIGRFAFQAATDPLNLLGTGIIPVAGHGLAALAHVSDLPGVAHGLQALNLADKAPGALTDGAMHLANSLFGKPALGLIGQAEPYVSGFADAHPELSDAWTTANRMWRASVHMVPGFPLRNLGSDLTRNLAFGDPQSSIDTLRGVPGAFKATLKGTTPSLDGTSTGDFLNTFGGDLDPSITDINVPKGGSIFRRLQNTQQRTNDLGNPVFDYTGNPIMDPAVNNPKDWAVDKLSGWNEWMNRADANQDLITRAPVWGNHATQAISDRMDNMADWLGRNGASDSTLNDFIDQHGMMSPSELSARLEGDGLSASDAQSAGESWQRAVNDAQQEGTSAVYRQQFDYSHQANSQLSGAKRDLARTLGRDPTDADLMAYLGLDKQGLSVMRGQSLLGNLATNTFGSYKFVTQDLPTMMRLSASHPALANVPAEWDRQSDIYNATHGLPGSMHGEMPLFDVGGNKIFGNPLELSDFPMLVDAATHPSIGDRNAEPGDASPLGQLMQGAGEIGFGLNPLVRAGLQVTGQMGHTQMSNVVKPLGLASGVGAALLGRPVDLEGPIKGAVADAQSALGQGNTYPYQEYLVRKREADLAQTGDKWSATQTNNPLYPQAQEDMAHVQALKDAFGALGLPSPEVVFPQQALIGQQKALSNMYAGEGMTALAQANPTKNAYSLVDPLAEAAERFETLPIDQRVALLRDPQFAQLISQKLRGINPGQQVQAGGY